MNKDVLPGRLGDPDMTLRIDPRVDRRLVAAAELAAEAQGSAEIPSGDVSYEEALTLLGAIEDSAQIANEAMRQTLPAWDNVDCTSEVIQGADGNDITLYVHTPVDVADKAPCIYHIHGGGMVTGTAWDPVFVQLRNNIAARGVVVVGIEFRNAAGRLGPHPFPAGLNDCAAGLQWVYDNKDQLGIDKIVVSGESGGGNLSLATTLKAKREGWVEKIDGVYAMCPYICGRYAQPPEDLPSLIENENYMLESQFISLMASVYDPSGEHTENPLAWPLYATAEDLQGLPPHVISVNELDQFRDEGLAFYRKLLAADIPARGRTVHGTVHGSELSFGALIPEVYSDLMASITNFARSL